jgi:hypothetical protein
VTSAKFDENPKGLINQRPNGCPSARRVTLTGDLLLTGKEFSRISTCDADIHLAALSRGLGFWDGAGSSWLAPLAEILDRPHLGPVDGIKPSVAGCLDLGLELHFAGAKCLRECLPGPGCHRRADEKNRQSDFDAGCSTSCRRNPLAIGRNFS